MGAGSAQGLMGSLMGVGQRILTGESVFLTHFTNERRQKRKVAFSYQFIF